MKSAELSRLRITQAKRTEERAWLADVSAHRLQELLRLGQEQAAGPESRPSAYTNAFCLQSDGTVYVAEVGNLKVKWSRRLPAAPTSLTVTKDSSGRYFLSFVVDTEPDILPRLQTDAGLDLGLNSSTTVALHLAKGADLSGTRWWFDSAVASGVKFDAIGLSYYGYWHGSLYDFQTALDDAAARYGKPVFVAETADPFRLDGEDSHENIINTTGELVSGYPANTAGQRRWMNDVTSIVEAVPNGRGLGVFYWEATWTAVSGNGWDPTDASSGNGWENQALFGYDDAALSSMAWFGHR